MSHRFLKVPIIGDGKSARTAFRADVDPAHAAEWEAEISLGPDGKPDDTHCIATVKQVKPGAPAQLKGEITPEEAAAFRAARALRRRGP